MDPSNLTWLKPLKLMHSKPLLMNFLKGGGARNKKHNRMEQDCFVETHLEPVQ
jgi:hypothetical protein